MATLTVTLPAGTTVVNGKQVTFRAPCDCAGISGIVINGTTYTLVDATTEQITGHTFKKDAMVSVIMDTENKKAFVQNGIIYGVQSVELTQSAYDALVASGGIDDNTFYIIIDDSEIAGNGIYGVIWDGTSSSKLARTDSAAMFVDPVPAVGGGTGSSPFDKIMPWAGMARSIRPDVGEVVSIPKFWFKWTKSGNALKLQIADHAEPGFMVSPAHMDRGDGKGERDFVYVGRYHCNASYTSASGLLPVNNTSILTMRPGVQALGEGVYMLDFATRLTIQMLYLVEFGDWDAQKCIGYGCGNNVGVQEVGYSDAMQYHTGTMQTTVNTYGVGVQYRWIEDLWGNVNDIIEGCVYAQSQVKIIINPSRFAEYTSYGTLVGTPASGLISAVGISTVPGFEWVMYPTAAGGTNTTYLCDQMNYYSSYAQATTGGSYSHSRNAGMFSQGAYNMGNDHQSVGCRLMVLP